MTLPFLLLNLGCHKTPDMVTILASPALQPALVDYVAFLDRTDVQLQEDTGQKCKNGGVRLTLTPERGDCYAITKTRKCVAIEGGLLGVQYGLSDVLEQAGIGFFHPHANMGPEQLVLPENPEKDWQCPDMARRGIHLHTLHPTEGYFDAWESGGDTTNIRRIGDWVIKNRGNHLQWVGLDSMPSGWAEKSKAMVDALHTRGLTTGLGVQLFSEANLQKAFNLVEHSNQELGPQMTAEWQRVTSVGFDMYNLSFGEFFSSEVESFLAAINLGYDLLREQDPGAEMTTVLHVGDEQRVEYEGEEWIYYLVAQFADEAIVPWVHTVMFYNLFDDAGGAYHHEEFDQHREVIETRLAEGKPVGYFPESAYWCAFDSSVPQYLPVYIQSRWKDLVNLPGLQDHVLFSSGWEWGYWLHDVATLRMNWSTPTDHCEIIDQVLAPLGTPEVSGAVCSLSRLQYEALIENRLAPWTASFDVAMEMGMGLGIVAQPVRTPWDELGEPDRATATALEDLAASTLSLAENLPTSDNPWIEEIVDGMMLNVHRSLFMAHLIEASIDRDESRFESAEAEMAAAREVIQRRHGKLWDPTPERLTAAAENHTFYPFGYLYMAEEMCFWTRELTQARNFVTGDNETVPGCLQ